MEVKDLLDTLTERAKNNYERTLDEIKGSNIFELIDLYNNKKNDITNVLEKIITQVTKSKKAYLRKLNIITKELKHLKVLLLE